jgi:long-chain fatty acid transport protein
VALDKEPIPSATDRTPRIPGNDRKWVSVGANYKLNKGMSVDVGYSHLFVKNTDINNTHSTSTANYTLNGTYKADVDIVGAQLNWRF